MNDLISRKKLLEQTAEWEAAALEQVGKHDPRNDPDEREEWIRWSAVLQERTAFKLDVQDAPAEHPELHEWCTDCKEYDTEKHCCPRYNRVIREALTEAQKTGKWIKHPKSLWPIARCSECKAICVYADTAKYCPVCGAKMEV